MAEETPDLAEPLGKAAVPASTPPAPTAAPSKPSLIDQYELGDTDPGPVEVSAPVAQEPPATAEPETPRPLPPKDPATGRFVKAEKHSARLRQAALDFGLSDLEIDEYSPAALETTVLHYQRQARELTRDNNREKLLQAGGENQAPLVSPVQDGQQPSAAEDDLGLVEDQYDPQLLGVIKRQAKELKELKQLVGQLAQGERSRQIETVYQQCERAFERHKEVLGEGRAQDFGPDDPNMTRRKAVLGIVQTMKTGTLQQRIDKAVESLFGKAAAAPASREQPHPNGRAISAEQWDAAAVAKPTHRAGAEEPKGRAKAERAVAAALKEMGSNADDLPEDAFPE